MPLITASRRCRNASTFSNPDHSAQLRNDSGAMHDMLSGMSLRVSPMLCKTVRSQINQVVVDQIILTPPRTLSWFVLHEEKRSTGLPAGKIEADPCQGLKCFWGQFLKVQICWHRMMRQAGRYQKVCSPTQCQLSNWSSQVTSYTAVIWYCRHIVTWPSDIPLFVRGVASAKQS